MSASTISGLARKGMRSPFWSLMATQFKVEYGQRGMAEKMGLGKRSKAAYLLAGVTLLAFFPIIVVLYRLGEALAVQSVALGQPGLPIVSAVMVGQLMVFFIGFSALMSTLYYAQDLETLLALPLTGRQILASKVATAYVTQLLVSSVLLFPFAVPLGLEVGGIAFWVSLLLVNLAVPAIPLALALLFTVFMMRVTSGFKRRDLFRVVLGLMFFVALMGFQYVNARMTTRGPEEVVRAIMERNGLVQVVAGHYPPLEWAARAMTGIDVSSRMGGLLLFAGVSAATLGIVATRTERWFLGGIASDVRTTAKRAPRRPGRLGTQGRLDEAGTQVDVRGRFSKARNPATAVAIRDLRVLTRTPNFLLVTLTNIAIVPVMWIFSAASGGEFKALFGSLGGGAIDAALLIMVAVQGGLAAMNQVSSTSISREGGTFWLSKMIPVPAKKQVRGKVGYSLVVSAVQLVTLLVPARLVLGLDAARIAVLAVLGLLVSWPVSVICVLNDLHSPRLSWTEPHQAMKGNWATLGAMLLSAVYLLAGGLAVRTALRAGMAGAPLYALIGFLVAASGGILQRYLEGKAGQRYRDIEV